MPNIPHEYGCEDCDLMYTGVPVVTELGDGLCPACAASREDLLDTGPYEFDDDYDDGYEGDLFEDLICDDPTEAE